MAVHAIARFASFSDVGTTGYSVNIAYDVRDGSNPHQGSTVVVSVPFGTDSANANHYLREAVAADIFSQFSLTIDPGDIFCPVLS